MKSEFSPAEDTAALLLRGDGSGLPVLIPGAFERRARASTGPRGDGTRTQMTDREYPVVVSPSERLVYEREGGGAPSERSGRRQATILQKLWRRLRRRPEVGDTSRLLVSPADHEKCATVPSTA